MKKNYELYKTILNVQGFCDLRKNSTNTTSSLQENSGFDSDELKKFIGLQKKLEFESMTNNELIINSSDIWSLNAQCFKATPASAFSSDYNKFPIKKDYIANPEVLLKNDFILASNLSQFDFAESYQQSSDPVREYNVLFPQVAQVLRSAIGDDIISLCKTLKKINHAARVLYCPEAIIYIQETKTFLVEDLIDRKEHEIQEGGETRPYTMFVKKTTEQVLSMFSNSFKESALTKRGE